MRNRFFIFILLIFLVGHAFLLLPRGSCAPDAHAEIQPEWILIDGTEIIDNFGALMTDGHRLYTYARGSVLVSADNGYTWRSTPIARTVTTVAVSREAVYASGSSDDGLFRSDHHGETWKQINNGITTWEMRDGGISYAYIRQILPTTSGTIIAVGYHDGTFISRDRGETWREIYDEWILLALEGHDWAIGRDIWSMAEFDGYLWAAISSYRILRSPDEGETWEYTSPYEFGRVADWAVLDDQLYIAGDEGFARWNDAGKAWDDLSQGLPPHSHHEIKALAVNRGRIFAGLRNSGVWMFDDRSETWIPAGLQEFYASKPWRPADQTGLSVYSLVSHQSELYAVSGQGIYRASIPIVQPYGKTAVTWGAVKQNE